LRSDSAWTVAQLRLGNLIGLSGPADAAPVDSALPPPLPFTQEEAVAELRTSGPELVAVRASERRAEALLSSEKEAYLPNISVGATAGAYDAEFWPAAFKRRSSRSRLPSRCGMGDSASCRWRVRAPTAA
jgi:outer membrane protein TolC